MIKQASVARHEVSYGTNKRISQPPIAVASQCFCIRLHRRIAKHTDLCCVQAIRHARNTLERRWEEKKTKTNRNETEKERVRLAK